MSSNIEERRKYLRLDTVNIVKVKVDRKLIKKPSEAASTFTKNISVEGMCLTSDKPFEIGKKLSLEIQLPGDSKPLRIRGQVQWVRSVKAKDQAKKTFEVGIKLFTIDKSDSTRFMGYVCNHMAARMGKYLHL